MTDKTTRVVPLTGIMTEDSVQRAEFIACDLPAEEADRLVKAGSAVKVLKSEVPEGARVEISAPVVETVPETVPAPAAPIRIQLGATGEAAKAVREDALDLAEDAPVVAGIKSDTVLTVPTREAGKAKA